MRAKIEPLSARFLHTSTGAIKLVNDVKGLVKPPPAVRGHPGLPQMQLNLIYELAFVRCVLAWEDFLYSSMCAYLTGAKGLSGRQAKPRAKIGKLATAGELLVGERDFLSWTSKDRVCSRAAIWFEDGEPYETALNNFTTYEELRRVRNRIVHNSGSAQIAFRKLAKSKYRKAHGLGPGAFLARSLAAGGTRLDAYAADLATAVVYISTN
jgi:hypothetical protein